MQEYKFKHKKASLPMVIRLIYQKWSDYQHGVIIRVLALMYTKFTIFLSHNNNHHQQKLIML